MNWPRKRFGELAAFRNGLNFSAEDRGGDLSVLGVGDFNELRLDTSDHLETVRVASGQGRVSYLQPGDLVFVRSNGSRDLVGRCVYVSCVTRPTSHSGFTIKARVTSDLLNPQWAAAVFQSGLADRALGRGSPGTNISNVTQGILASVELPLPSRALQDASVCILDCADRASAHLESLLSAKRSLKRGLMQELLTGRRRFPEPGSRQALKETRLGRLPSDWKVEQLGAHAKPLSHRNSDRFGPEKVMGVVKGTGLIPMRERSRAADLRRYKVVPANGFAYNPMRLNIGSIARNRFAEECLVSPDYVVFQTDPASLLPQFLDQLRHSRIWQNHINAAGSGSVRIRIYFDSLSKMTIPVPPLAEQARIAATLELLDTEIATYRALLSTFESQKFGVMQQLLNGNVVLHDRIGSNGRGPDHDSDHRDDDS